MRRARCFVPGSVGRASGRVDEAAARASSAVEKSSVSSGIWPDMSTGARWVSKRSCAEKRKDPRAAGRRIAPPLLLRTALLHSRIFITAALAPGNHRDRFKSHVASCRRSGIRWVERGGEARGADVGVLDLKSPRVAEPTPVNSSQVQRTSSKRPPGTNP